MASRNLYQLFVGNLPWTVSRKELTAYFTGFGRLKNAHVVFDNKTGLSKGYGFVEFVDKESYTNAISHEHHILENSKLKIGVASSKKKDHL